MRQKRPDVPPIINANESHMALVFVLDVSLSMEDGGAIEQLNEGFNRFKEEVCDDKQTRKILDVAVIKFNDEFEVVQDFVPVEYVEPLELEADGPTYYTEPIREAMKMVTERSHFYREAAGSEPYKPWILFVTDGAPLDDIAEVTHEVRKMQADGQVRFIALGVGDYDSKSLHQLTDAVFRMEGKDFTSFFNWVGKSMRVVSQSSPSDKPAMPPLEGDVSRDTNFLND